MIPRMTNRYDNTDENNSSNLGILTSNNNYGVVSPTAQAADNDLGDHLENPYTFGCQTRQPDSGTSGVQANRFPSPTRNIQNNDISEKEIFSCYRDPSEPFCHVKMDSITQLKDSTKKLLCLLQEIQVKTCSMSSMSKLPNDVYQLNGFSKQSSSSSGLPSMNDVLGLDTIKRLETQVETVCKISTEDIDDCSIYKRLTRKCHCLNQEEYNDFMIHFNEGTKYFTSTMGEIIKNIRILKKFLYMGGEYTKRALIFLNEGYSFSTHKEKVEITQGCAHADICNVFDDYSIVIVGILRPCNDEKFGDATTQAKAALFLNQQAQLEEGRRYLKFSSKIINDIKKVVRTKASALENDTLESLNATLNLLSPPMTQNTFVNYYCKPVDEGFGSKTVTALLKYRQYMTLEEVFTHLDLLCNLSNNNSGRNELTTILAALLILFKHMLIEYDNSELNIIITNILNNVVSKSMVKPLDLPKTVIMADTGTEPIFMKHEINQHPSKKTTKKTIKTKIRLDVSSSPTKFRHPIKGKDFSWDISQMNTNKFAKDPYNSVIVVPVEGVKNTQNSSIFTNK